MPRKGWTALETPNGWFQMIRGPRPPSVRWEKAPQQEQRGGRWRQPKAPVLQQFPQRTATTRGAPRQNGNAFPSAPGPRLKTSGLRPFQDPDSRVVAAKDRVSRLERALEAMGDSEGPEVDGLRAALEKAREFAKGVPLEKQIKDGEQFLIRAKGHLVELEKERSTVEASIADAERRLEKLRAQADLLPPQAPMQPPPSVLPMSDMEAEIKRLREQVAELEGTSATQERPRVRQRISGVAGGGFIPVMPGLIPAELCQWIEDRQTDLQEALVDGNTARVLELTSKMAEGAEQLREITCSRMVP